MIVAHLKWTRLRWCSRLIWINFRLVQLDESYNFWQHFVVALFLTSCMRVCISLCVSWILWINLSWFINRWNSNDLQHNTSLTRNGLMWSINSLFIFCYLPATIPSHNPWSHAFLNSMALHNCKDKNMLWIFRNLACVCVCLKNATLFVFSVFCFFHFFFNVKCVCLLVWIYMRMR